MTFPAIAFAMSASLVTYTVVESYPSPLMALLDLQDWPSPAVHRGALNLNDDRRLRLLDTMATAERAWAAVAPGFKARQAELSAENTRLLREMRDRDREIAAHERAAAAMAERYETLLRQVMAMAGSERARPVEPPSDPRDHVPARPGRPAVAPEIAALMARPLPEPGAFEREEPGEAEEAEADFEAGLSAHARAILVGRGRGPE